MCIFPISLSLYFPTYSLLSSEFLVTQIKFFGKCKNEKNSFSLSSLLKFNFVIS